MTRCPSSVPAVAAFLACCFAHSVQAQAVISAGSASVADGDIFDIPVDISSVTDLYDFQFDLAFDPTLLQLQSVTEGSFLPSAGSTIPFPGIIDNTGGTVTFVLDTLVGPVPGASGSGTIENLSFQAVGVGTSSLTLSNVILQDSTGADIPFTISNGSVTVSASSVPEPQTWTWTGPILALLLLIAHKPFRAMNAIKSTTRQE